MAKYGANSFSMSFAASNITAHVQSINSVEVESILEDSKPINGVWAESLASGAQQMSDVEIEGLYDDAAGGPDAVLRAARPTGPASSPGATVLTWGGSKTTSFNAFVQKFARTVTKNQITRYKVTLKPTGTVTEA